MKYLSFWDYFSLIRSLIFLLVAFEAYFLGRLYLMAYREMKNSQIIKAIMVVFFSVSIMFSFLALVAFTNKNKNFENELLKAGLVIPAIILLNSLSSFRKKSLEEQIKSVSDKIKTI